jgi:murein L,D-transpeptidase YcbB/YkuD
MASSILAAVRVAAVALAATAVSAQSPDVAASLNPARPAPVRGFLDASGSPLPLCATAEGREIWSAVQAFYAARDDRPVWFDGDRLSPAGQRLVDVLRSVVDEGLDPSRYDPSRLAGAAPRVLQAAAGAEPSTRETASWEVGLTAALARYASDLARGGVDPSRVTVLWRLRPRAFDVLPVLMQAADTGRPDVVLDAIRPVHPQYDALRDALGSYATLLAREPEVPLLPARIKLRPGARSPHVRTLRARLAFWGDLQGRAGTGDVLDRPLVEALKRFQARHGLVADGTVGPDVVAALNTPVRDRLRQIVLNLERWRWQDRTTSPRSLIVNIPTFELHAYDAGRETLAMRVITGRAESPTPVFAQAMTAVVFSPYWNVPANIAQGETMPAVMRDRGYLRRMNLEVLRGDEVVDPRRVDWRRDAPRLSFRQRPGAGNSMGLVKFLLPNPFGVYLHDTPNDGLFLRARRTFSHGCVRLEKPEALARWVLEGLPGWTAPRIAAAMRAGRESAVTLPQPIPISIGYFTVWVDADGTVQFRPDVYRHDAAQGPLLEVPEAPESPLPHAIATLAAAG